MNRCRWLSPFGRLILAIVFLSCGNSGSVHYQATHASLRTHKVPDWFHDAKLGIFVHWGPSAVPGWVPVSRPPDFDEGVPPEDWFSNNPSAEWYLNSM